MYEADRQTVMFCTPNAPLKYQITQADLISNVPCIQGRIARRHVCGSQFDLKDAYVVVTDGTLYSGAVDGTAIKGATTIKVQGLPANTILPVGFPVLHNATSEYGQISAVAGSPTTTTITLTGAIAAAWADDEVLTFGPHMLIIKMGKGNLTATEFSQHEYNLDRGKLNEVRLADEQPMDVSFTGNWEFISSDSGDPPTLREALKKPTITGWESSDTDTCRPYAVNLEIWYSPPCADAKGEKVQFPNLRTDQIQFDATGGTLAVQGKCNVLEPVSTRVDSFPLITSF